MGKELQHSHLVVFTPQQTVGTLVGKGSCGVDASEPSAREPSRAHGHLVVQVDSSQLLGVYSFLGGAFFLGGE